jgi:hypothetical protein
MPNLNEFLGKKESIKEENLIEELPGSKPCSKCDLDVEGGFWDPQNLIMKWTCSDGHETIHRVG